MVILSTQQVLEAGSSLLPEVDRLPGGIQIMVTGIQKVHSVWRWIRKIQYLGNPQNVYALSAGHIADFFMQNCPGNVIGSRMIRIAIRIDECRCKQKELSRYYRFWRRCLRGHFVVSPATIRFEKNSLWARHRHRTRVIAKKIAGTIKVSIILIGKIFQLAMLTIDIYDTATSPANNGELFVDIRGAIMRHRRCLNVLLARANQEYTADRWLNNLPSLSNESTRSPGSPFGPHEGLAEASRRIIFGLALVVGAQNELPPEYTPNPGRFIALGEQYCRAQSSKEDGRYPPEAAVKLR